MNIYDKTILRYSVLCGVILAIVLVILDHHGVPQHNENIETALAWNFYGAMLPSSMVGGIWRLTIALFCIGGIGFALLKGWSRHLLLASIALDLFFSPFLGLSVVTGWQRSIYSASFILVIVPLVLSYSLPASKYFEIESDSHR